MLNDPNFAKPDSQRPETGMMPFRKPKLIEFAVAFFIGATFLGGTLYFTDLNAVADGIRRIGPVAVATAAIMSLLQVVICSVRWKIVADHTSGPLTFRNTVRGYFEATFVNAFFPTLIASDGARVLRAIASGANPTPAFVGVVTDRLVALLGLAVASASGLVFLRGTSDNPFILLMIAGLLPAFIFGVAILDLLSKLFQQLSHLRLIRPFLELASHMRYLRRKPKLTFIVVLISLIGHLACAAAFYILALQLGMDVGYWEMFALSAPILVYAAIPVSIGGWGIREAVTALLFSTVGIAPSLAIALSIAFGLLMVGIGLICGLVALMLSFPLKSTSSS